MIENDVLRRFIFENAPVRGEYIRLHETFNTIVHQHDYPPLIKTLLGEALCVVGLLAAVIKFNGRLSVQFRGNGAIKFFLAQCDNQFNMRALAKWEGDIGSEAELVAALKQGTLAILLDSELHRNRYQGIVAWCGHSLAESIEGYFKNSEQLPTKLWLRVENGSAAGLLLQVVPAAEGSKAHIAMEKEITDPHWARLIAQAEKLHPKDMLELSYEDLLRKIYPLEDIRVFKELPVQFRCSCSRQRGEDAISLLGKEEAEEELKDKQVLDVTCDFCNTKYTFDKVDVAKIFAGKSDGPPDTHLH